MKRSNLGLVYLAIMLLGALLVSFGASAQVKVKQDASGNFIQVSSRGVASAAPVATGKTFTTSKGETFPVYKSAKGRFFVLRTSKKSGKEYKQYLN